jgi:hypothetical protein
MRDTTKKNQSLGNLNWQIKTLAAEPMRLFLPVAVLMELNKYSMEQSPS